MDLRVDQLRRFLVLAEELHFTRAAARLHLSQQVLSAQTRALEEAVGVALLARSTRRVELTDAGQAFLTHATAAVDEVDAAVAAARGVGQVERVQLVCQVDAQWVLAEALQAVDPTELQVETLYAVDVATTPEGLRVDAVIRWAPVPDADHERVSVLAVEEVMVVLRADDPLAAGEVAAVADLADHSLWMWPRTHGDPHDWDALVGHVDPGHESVIVLETAGTPAQERMIAAVQDNGGYTFAPSRYLAQARPSQVVGLSMDPPLRMAVTLAWAGVPSAGLQRLRRAVAGSGRRHTV